MPAPRRGRLDRRVGASVVILALLSPGATSADEIAALQQELRRIETEARHLFGRVKPPEPLGPAHATQRLIEAQELYEIERYQAAATLALQIVEQFPSAAAYPDALYVLADSHYRQRDYISARRFFAWIVKRGSKDRHYTDALERLIEISLHTNDFADVDRYLALLAAMPKTDRPPSVPYVRGKFHFFRGQIDEAVAAFREIGPDQELFFQAAYFLGACHVSRADVEGARPYFETIADAKPTSPAEEEIQSLAFLALGRLHYEANRFADAVNAYRRVPADSDTYGDALYELGHAHIKTEQFEEAYRAFELLVLNFPVGPRVPRVKLKMGQLLVRLGQHEKAKQWFHETRTEFKQVNEEFETAMLPDANPFAHLKDRFAQKAAREPLDVGDFIPRKGLPFAERDGEVNQMLTVSNDVVELSSTVRSLEELLARLERVVESPARISAFPELQSVRTDAVVLENRIVKVRLALVDALADLSSGELAPEERRRWNELSARRDQLEKSIGTLPITRDDFERLAAELAGKIASQSKTLSECKLMIQNLNAQIVAVEKYIEDTSGTSPQKLPHLEQQLNELRGRLAELLALQEVLRVQVTQEGDLAVSLRQAEQESRKAELVDLLRDLAVVLAQAASRKASAAGRRQAVARTMEWAEAAGGVLTDLLTRLDLIAEKRLTSIRHTLVRERQHLAAYKKELETLTSQSSEVGASVALASFQRTADRVREALVGAEVGIIDVAWARKMERSQRAEELKVRKADELKQLREAFKAALPAEE